MLSRGDASSMFQNKREPINRDTNGNTKLERMQIIFKHMQTTYKLRVVLNSAFQLTMVVPNDPNINIGMNRRYIDNEISKYTERHNKIKTNNFTYFICCALESVAINEAFSLYIFLPLKFNSEFTPEKWWD